MSNDFGQAHGALTRAAGMVMDAKQDFDGLSKTLDGQIANLQGKWAVVPECAGRHRHPIVVGREMIEAFLKAPTTSSAREVEHSLPDRILYLAVEDPLVAVNVDTPEDYEWLVTA